MTARRKRTNIDFQEEQELPKPKVFEKLCAAMAARAWFGVDSWHKGSMSVSSMKVLRGSIFLKSLLVFCNTET